MAPKSPYCDTFHPQPLKPRGLSSFLPCLWSLQPPGHLLHPPHMAPYGFWHSYCCHLHCPCSKSLGDTGNSGTEQPLPCRHSSGYSLGRSTSCLPVEVMGQGRPSGQRNWIESVISCFRDLGLPSIYRQQSGVPICVYSILRKNGFCCCVHRSAVAPA